MGAFIDKTWYEKKDNPHSQLCAGGAVLRKEADKIYVALVREAPFQECFLPKGKLEKNESPEEAAKREIAEETGISELRFIKFLKTSERYDIKKKNWKQIHYFLFETTQKDSVPLDTKHKYSILWGDINSDLPVLWPEQKELIAEIAEKYKKGELLHEG